MIASSIDTERYIKKESKKKNDNENIQRKEKILENISKSRNIRYRDGEGLIGFYGISTIVGYLMPNPFYTYTINTYDLVWFCLILRHINHCGFFISKSSLYKYIKYIRVAFNKFPDFLYKHLKLS